MLWTLVLLRLLAPPIFVLDLSGQREWFVNTVRRSTEQQTEHAEYFFARGPELVAAIAGAMGRTDLVPIEGFRAQVAATDSRPEATGGAESLASIAKSYFQVGWAFALFILLPAWAIGTVCCLFIQIRSAYLFQRDMRKHSYTSRIWQRRVQRVGRRMGLRSVPPILLVRAKISPMLWGFGFATRVLFPEKLLVRLQPREQDLLIAHELAHFRRGDQWIRLLELIATAIFWWHPVLWWAREEIELAEEQCCDALALRLSDGNRRHYAEALLSAVDFVSATELPPVASGATSVNALRQRMHAIMKERAIQHHKLTPYAYPGVIAFACLIMLPSAKFFGQPVMQPTLQLANIPVVGGNRSTVNQPLSELAPVPIVDSHIAIRVNSNNRAVFSNLQADVVRDLGVGHVGVWSLSPSQQQMAVGTLDGRVLLLDTATGATQREISVAHAAVCALTFSQEDDILAVATRDGLCKVIHLTGHLGNQVRRKRFARVTAIRFSPDQRYLSLVWRDRTGCEINEEWALPLERRHASSTER